MRPPLAGGYAAVTTGRALGVGVVMAPLGMSADAHIAAARRHMGDLARLSRVCDPDAGGAYQALVTGRSQLMGILATADMDEQP